MARQSKGSVGKKDPKLIARRNAVYSVITEQGNTGTPKQNSKTALKCVKRDFFFMLETTQDNVIGKVC